MGILDDLAMGFGLKERTQDYDARTARTIAANQASQRISDAGGSDHDAMVAGIRARQSYNPSTPTAQGRSFLDRAGARGGYDAGTYTPAIAEDNRPFMQRFMRSPESPVSPNPYAIGPMQFDEPIKLPALSLAGLLSSAFGGFGGNQDKPRVSTRREPATGKIEGGSGQPETGPEDFSGVEVAKFDEGLSDAEIGAIAMSALNAVPDVPPAGILSFQEIEQEPEFYSPQTSPSSPFYYENSTRVPDRLYEGLSEALGSNARPFPNERDGFTTDPRLFLDKPSIDDRTVSPAFGPNDTGYYDSQMMMGVATDQLFTPPPIGMRLIKTGPHAGKYIDANGRLRVL